MNMKFKILSVQFHDFQIVQQMNNFALAKCNCCSKSRFAVYKISEKNRFFYYHGFDQKYAQKLFSSLVSRFNSQQQIQ